MQSPRVQKRSPLGQHVIRNDDEGDLSSMSEEEQSSEDEEDDEDEHPDAEQQEHVLALYHCRQFGTTLSDSLFAFQIADAQIARHGIRISSTENSTPICSCDADGICRHISWLLDQLSQTGVVLGEDSPPRRYYSQISSVGLQRICERLKWDFQEEGATDDETSWRLIKQDHHQVRAISKTRSHEASKGRIKEIRDILAAFSNQPTEDYRRDIYDAAEDFSVKDILVQNDIEATISRLLLLDNDIFTQFQSLVTPELRASSYFKNMNSKARHSCRLLDYYAENGPSAGQTTQFDLIWCARELVSIVEAISTNVKERQPLSSTSRREAAGALISILTEVVKKRNTDVYRNETQLRRRRQHGEPSIDRNLYIRLIGKQSPQNPPGSAFVLDALGVIPEAAYFVRELRDLHSTLESIGWGPAPQFYLDRLSNLISLHSSQQSSLLASGHYPNPPEPSTSERSTTTSTSPSSGKRPGNFMDRHGKKRMK